MDEDHSNGNGHDESDDFENHFRKPKKPADLGDIRPDFNEYEDTENLMKVDPNNDPRNNLHPNHGQLERSLSTRSIAHSLIPKVAVLKKALKNADVYIKFERILEEFNSLIYYNSVIEIITWIIGLICFFSYPSQMGYIWLHFLHLPRGAVGIFMVLKRTPKTYDLIENISDFQKEQLEEHWGFEKMAQHIRENFKKHLVNVLQNSRGFYIAYFSLSWINCLLDLIGLLIQLIRFGTKGDEYSDLFMLSATIIFLYTFMSYAAWVMTFTFRISPRYRKDAMKAALGLSSGLRQRITDSFNKLKSKTFVRNQPPTRPENRQRNGTNRLAD